MTRKSAWNLILLIAVCVLTAVAVSAQGKPVASAIHFQHLIESKILGETRSVLVHVPESYDRGDRRYPVLYMTDAHEPQNAMIVGLTEQQAWGGTIPELIVVGIQNVDRSRDLTPTDDGKGGKVGGASKFLQFLETEVVPLVEKNYRTQPYRVFAGHSLGGLFAVYSLVERPDLFNAYIAASPVLDWDKDYVIKRAAE